MKKYVVKVTSIATEENLNFAGETDITYYGKDMKELAHEGDHAKQSMYGIKGLGDNPWLIDEYGYSRACDAKRSWVYKNPENSKFWQSTAEIVEAEV